MIGEQALPKTQLYQTFGTRWFVAFIICLADSMQSRAQTLGKSLAAFSLAGPGRSVQQNVDALFTAIKCTSQQAKGEVAPSAKVLKIVPVYRRRPDRGK